LSITVTIADIARKLKTTSATVSRALNDHPAISAKTKKTVLRTAEKMNYRRNNVASSLRLGQTGIIGVIIPSAEINFFGSVVHGIESIANQNGYNVLIYQSNESAEHEKKGIETFLNARVDGIIVSMAKETRDYDHFEYVKKIKDPIVFFDRAQDALNIDSVLLMTIKEPLWPQSILSKRVIKELPTYLVRNISASLKPGLKDTKQPSKHTK